MIVNGNNKYIVLCISFTMSLYKNVGVVVKSVIKIMFRVEHDWLFWVVQVMGLFGCVQVVGALNRVT